MDIFQVLYKNKNKENAEAMSKYMRNLFPFIGIRKPELSVLIKEFLKIGKKDTRIDWDFIFQCFEMPEREFQYLAISYMEINKKLFTEDDMENIEKLIIRKSWWDSVDAIKNIVAYMAMEYPQLKENTIIKWTESKNIWLIRTSIIFQLKYKEDTDTSFLEKAILANSETSEFFINKAIGWALREYSKTNKEWVREFINTNSLSKLSIREASKYI